MQNPHNLLVTSKARAMAKAAYVATQRFPKDERFGLITQVRRAAASVGANIFEGCGRSGDRELISFLHIAMGSATELEFHCLLARDLEFGDSAEVDALTEKVDEIKKMLAALILGIERPKRQRPGSHSSRGRPAV